MQTAAIFFGGKSNEREISVITGVYAVNLLRSTFEVLPVFLDERNEMFLMRSAREVGDFREEERMKRKKEFVPVRLTAGGLWEVKKKRKIPVDCALNCCHGGLCEGGGLSALLEWHQIASASPAMTPSAVFLDKAVSKIVLKGLDIPVAPYDTLHEAAWRTDPAREIKQIVSTLGLPVIVKPSKLGSSIGISVAKTEEELSRALELCFRLDDTALIETYFSKKRDLNCAAYRLHGELTLSPVEEVFSASPILSFEEKYEETSAARKSRQPAQIPSETEEEIKTCLSRLMNAFSINGIVRADFLLCDDKLFFNELNTVPGTLATYLFGGESLLAAKNLLESLLQDAIRQNTPPKQILTSGILSRQTTGGKRRKLSQ